VCRRECARSDAWARSHGGGQDGSAHGGPWPAPQFSRRRPSRIRLPDRLPAHSNFLPSGGYSSQQARARSASAPGASLIRMGAGGFDRQTGLRSSTSQLQGSVARARSGFSGWIPFPRPDWPVTGQRGWSVSAACDPAIALHPRLEQGLITSPRFSPRRGSESAKDACSRRGPSQAPPCSIRRRMQMLRRSLAIGPPSLKKGGRSRGLAARARFAQRWRPQFGRRGIEPPPSRPSADPYQASPEAELPSTNEVDGG